jgi:hypothetical protein
MKASSEADSHTKIRVYLNILELVAVACTTRYLTNAFAELRPCGSDA